MYDVVIISAGPAGSSTAYYLARYGYYVLLLDKEHFPREKVCGDGLTPRALVALEAMGLSRTLRTCMKVKGVRVVEHHSGAQRLSFFKGRDGEPDFGIVLPRYTLDNLLCEAAKAGGVECWMGATALEFALDARGAPEAVYVRREGEVVRVRGRFFVIAEGSVGKFARRMRRSSLGRTDVGFAVRQYMKGVRGLEPFFEFHLPLTFRGGVLPGYGYGWVFPIGEDLINVGVGFSFGKGIETKVKIQEVYACFLATLRESDERFHSLEAGSPLKGAPVRIGLVPRETVSTRVVAVGDSAGLVNPFTGEGIAYALESGDLAATAIHEAFVKGIDEARRYPAYLADRYRRHSRLRSSLPTFFGLTRLYDWHPLPLGSSPKGILLKCLLKVISDREQLSEDGLRQLLWKGLFDNPMSWYRVNPKTVGISATCLVAMQCPHLRHRVRLSYLKPMINTC